ncbi:MAG: LPD1 domain-containing protein [Acutalibacteraceae bacterium]|nr:LPD1 domain-containing protein [Acutalibacteraceae bacterium]
MEIISKSYLSSWVNEAERQTNMNMAFDSFKDMAKALNINDEDISLGGKLSIAFGARGFSRALAHYESAREVINLTKMKGAGSLAHEYFHAMDDIAGKLKGNNGKFATEQRDKSSAFTELVNALRYKERVLSAEENKQQAYEAQTEREEKLITELRKMVPDSRLSPEKIEERDKLISTLLDQAKDNSQRINISPICKFINEYSDSYEMDAHNKKWLTSRLDNIRSNIEYLSTLEFTETTAREETEFYKNAKQLDTLYAKSDKGYWSSDIELAARAFACYIHDKLKEQGITNDYLTGHAFMVGQVPTYPSKEERKEINKVFDKVIEEMKEMGIFHNREETQLAAETEHCFVVAERTENYVHFIVMDKDFNEISDAKMMPQVSLQAAIKQAVSLNDRGSEITQMDYSVFEAKKAARQEELHKAAQQKALQESMNITPIDPDSYEQMTLEDMIAAAETACAKIEKSEPTQNKIADLQAEIDKLSKQYQVHTDAIKETNKRLAEIRNAMQEEGTSLFATDNRYSAERKELHKYNEVNKDAAFEIQQQIKELNQKINDIKAEQERQNNQAVYEAAPKHKQRQLDIILATNPMTDDYHVGIRSVEDIKTFEEAIQDNESFAWGDFDKDDAAKALKTGQITVYSSHPIEQGGFVSTSYNMAQDYAGDGKVYVKRVSIEDVAWINGDEGQFAKVPEKELKREKPSKSTRKSDRDER